MGRIAEETSRGCSEPLSLIASSVLFGAACNTIEHKPVIAPQKRHRLCSSQKCVDPLFQAQALRENPRFQSLERRVGLNPCRRKTNVVAFRSEQGAEAEGGEDHDFGIDDVAISNRRMGEIKDHGVKRED